MNVLMLHPHDLHYFPWTIRIIRLGLELVKLGHRVTLGYIEYPYKDSPQFEKKIRHRLPEGMDYLALGTRARHFSSNLIKLRGIKPRFDLVHFQKCFSTMALPALYLAYSLDCPVHYDWDDNEAGLAEEWIRFRPARWEVKLYERLLPKLVDSMTTASEELRLKAIERGMKTEDIFPAPVGADLEAFHPGRDGSLVRRKYGLENHEVILYMGQLGGAAYADLLLDAVPIVVQQVPGARFLIVGGGRHLKSLQQQAQMLGVHREVIFTDYVPQDEVPQYVAAADIAAATFVDNEITRCKSPLKIAEYLAAGKPIVASRVGEVPRMLGDSGILIRPGSVHDLADALLKYIRQPELRQEHAISARKRAEAIYNWQTTAASLLKAYDRAFCKRRKHSATKSLL